MPISTNGAIITRVAGALYGEYLSNASYNELALVSTIAPATVAANFITSDFMGKTDAQIATTVLTNLGLSSVAGLNNWLAAQMTAAGSTAAAKGAKLVDLLNSFSTMTTDATYGSFATTFNNNVNAALTYSQTAGAAGGSFTTAAATATAAAAAAAKAVADAAAAKVAADAAAAAKIVADAAAAAKVLTDASDKAAAAAAIDAATAADTAVTNAQTALTAANTKAALTDAVALTAATTTATTASTAAAATKTAADTAVVTAQTAFTNAITAGVVNDINTANANLLIAQARATTAATAATTAATAAATAKTASDAATADDVAAAAAQTALNTAVTAATKAAADAVTAAAAARTAAAATVATADDTTAASYVTAAAARGAGAAKITADAAAAKVASDAAAAAAAAKVIADAAAAKVIADAAAAKVIADAAAAKVVADALALTLVAKNFTLTTGTDVATGGDGNDTYTATHLTLNAGDVIDGGAGTADTLTITDSGTAVWTLPTSASVSNFEIVKLKNVNTLSAGSSGTKEVATLTVGALKAGQTITMAGQTLLATADLPSATVGAALATADVANTDETGTGWVLSGNLSSSYVKTAGTASNQVVYTAATAGVTTDLAVTGNALVSIPQTTVLTITGSTIATTATHAIVVNGVSIPVAAIGTADTPSLLAANVATAINGFIGSPVATAAGATVQIVSRSTINVGTLTPSAGNAAASSALASSVQTYQVTTAPTAAATVSFFINGTQVTTAATAGTASNADTATKIMDAINAFYGATVATLNTATITINTGKIGLAIGGFTATAGTIAGTLTATTANSGMSTTESPVISIAQGTAAVSATTGADVLDASKFVGATNIQNDVSTGAVTINNVASTQSVTINGNGALTNGATTVQSASTSTSSNVTVSGVTGGALTLSSAGGVGVQTATLTSSGDITNATVTPISKTNVLGGVALGGAATALNIVANTNLTTGGVTGFAGTTATITATGSGTALNLGTLENTTVRTVDASGFAGAVTATLNSNGALSFKGGAGNDVITTGAVLTTGSVDAGAGTGDVLVVGTNLSHVNTATLGAKYTNFEAIRLNGTYDATLVPGITSVQLTGSTNTITNLSPAQTVVARADIGSSTLAPVSGTTNTLNMTLGQGTTTLAATNASTLTLNGYETLNVTTNSGPTAAVGADRTSTISAFTAANLTKVNLFGTSVALSNIATTLAVAVDGSSLTGNGDLTTDAITGLTVAGNAVSGSSFKGSAVRDSFTLGTAVASTYDAGAGNDFFSATAAQIGDAVTDPTLIGGDGTDTINITSTLTLVDSDFKKLTSFEKLNLGATTAVSVTGLTTNTVAAFPTTLTVTGSTLANGATYSWESLAYDKNTLITLVTAGDLAGTDDNVTIVTGAGNDTVTITGASAVAAAGAGGTISITTGAGVDTITVSTGILLANTNQSVAINAGTGADVITVTTGTNATSAKGNVLFTVAAGDSNTTAYDVITGFKMSDIGGTGGKVSHQIDFAGTGAIATYAATAAAGFTAAQLTVAVSSAGLVTFAGTSAASITLDQAIAAVQSVVATSNGETAVFTYTTSGVTDTYVFNNNTTDSVVRLVGISAAALITTNDATTDNGIFIS